MADIFVSYKRSDREHVRWIVGLLEKRGWSVWWDAQLSAGEHWDSVIEREINESRCVVVVWSPRSINRATAYWVHLEAHTGLERGILVPVLIEHVSPPFAFRLIQARDLSGWDGASLNEAARGFISDVARMVGRNPTACVTPQPLQLPITPPAQVQYSRIQIHEHNLVGDLSFDVLYSVGHWRLLLTKDIGRVLVHAWLDVFQHEPWNLKAVEICSVSPNWWNIQSGRLHVWEIADGGYPEPIEQFILEPWVDSGDSGVDRTNGDFKASIHNEMGWIGVAKTGRVLVIQHIFGDRVVIDTEGDSITYHCRYGSEELAF